MFKTKNYKKGDKLKKLSPDGDGYLTAAGLLEMFFSSFLKRLTKIF